MTGCLIYRCQPGCRNKTSGYRPVFSACILCLNCRCQLCNTDLLFSFLDIGLHMRNKHPSIDFLQYRLTHLHDPNKSTSSASLGRRFRCRFCRAMVAEPDLFSHLDRRHREDFDVMSALGNGRVGPAFQRTATGFVADLFYSELTGTGIRSGTSSYL